MLSFSMAFTNLVNPPTLPYMYDIHMNFPLLHYIPWIFLILGLGQNVGLNQSHLSKTLHHNYKKEYCNLAPHPKDLNR